MALPIWNFVLPVYAYWHFDDFSWGETRKTTQKDVAHEDIGHEKLEIPRLTWDEWTEWGVKKEKEERLKHIK